METAVREIGQSLSMDDTLSCLYCLCIRNRDGYMSNSKFATTQIGHGPKLKPDTRYDQIKIKKLEQEVENLKRDVSDLQKQLNPNKWIIKEF